MTFFEGIYWKSWQGHLYWDQISIIFRNFGNGSERLASWQSGQGGGTVAVQKICMFEIRKHQNISCEQFYKVLECKTQVKPTNLYYTTRHPWAANHSANWQGWTFCKVNLLKFSVHAYRKVQQILHIQLDEVSLKQQITATTVKLKKCNITDTCKRTRDWIIFLRHRQAYTQNRLKT